MIRDHHNEIALDNVLGPFLLLGRFPNQPTPLRAPGRGPPRRRFSIPPDLQAMCLQAMSAGNVSAVTAVIQESVIPCGAPGVHRSRYDSWLPDLCKLTN